MRTTSTTIEDRIKKYSHVSWGAILAGFAVALAILFLLNLLGVGIGLSTINPMEEAHPLEGIGWGTIIWWTISNLIAIFIGGMIAGRLAGFTDKMDGAIHGAIVWCLYVLLTIWLITAAVGNVFSGMAGAAGTLFSGSDAKELVDLKKSSGNAEKGVNAIMDKMKNQMAQVLNSNNRSQGQQPNNSASKKDTLNRTNGSTNMLLANIATEDYFNEVNFDTDENGELHIKAYGTDGKFLQTDKLKMNLKANTNLSDQEINELTQKWEQDLEKTANKAESVYNKTREKALEYSQKAADAMAKFSIAAFFALIIGIIAALVGGAVGSDQLVVYQEEYEIETTTQRENL